MKSSNIKTAIIFFLFLLVLPIGFAQLVNVGSDSGTVNVGGASGGGVNVGPVYQDPCGNGIIEINLAEQCDGSSLGGATCLSLFGQGYSGSVSCSSTCTYQTSCSYSSSNDTGGSDDGSSGGSSGGRGGAGVVTGTAGGSCVENWQCSSWGTCSNGLIQKRSCLDFNNCGTTLVKPSETRDCKYPGLSGEDGITGNNPQNRGLLSRITGAVIGGGAASIWALVFVILIIGISIWIYMIRNKSK